MQKTVICSYWENKICKFMKNPSMCSYAHGIEYINKVNCKYGSKCCNPKCDFNHGIISTIPNMVYEIPIIKKRKNKKLIKKIKDDEICEQINIPKKQIGSNIYNIIDKEDNSNYKLSVAHIDPPILENDGKIIIINKEKGINDVINIFNKDFNNTLSIIDDFYVKKYNNIVNEKNKYISNIVKNNYNEIYKLRTINKDKDLIINKITNENISLKKTIEYLENENKNNQNVNTLQMVDMVDINKYKKLYNKYIKLYEIFNNNSYKLINIEEIRKYTQDKNIYKLKQRAYKVYSFYEKYKKGFIKDLLPISKIITMVF